MTRRSKRLIVAVCAFPFVTYFGFVAAYWYAPTIFSSHRTFYAQCAEIRVGLEPGAALRMMRGYVLARRAGAVNIDDGLIASAPTPSPDNDGGTVFLLYPTPTATADWCVVRFHDGRVSAVAMFPD